MDFAIIHLLSIEECKRSILGHFHLYRGTVLQQRHMRPQQLVLLVRGLLKGEPGTILAAELGLNYLTVLEPRRDLQDQAQQMQADTPLPDEQTETDEMFHNLSIDEPMPFCYRCYTNPSRLVPQPFYHSPCYTRRGSRRNNVVDTHPTH
jgi:hypothetical protein